MLAGLCRFTYSLFTHTRFGKTFPLSFSLSTLSFCPYKPSKFSKTQKSLLALPVLLQYPWALNASPSATLRALLLLHRCTYGVVPSPQPSVFSRHKVASAARYLVRSPCPFLCQPYPRYVSHRSSIEVVHNLQCTSFDCPPSHSPHITRLPTRSLSALPLPLC